MNKYYLVFNDHNKSNNPLLKKYIENNLQIVDKVESADYILVAGGDGSLLQAIRNYYTYNIPFIGINAGTLGYYMHDVDNDESKVKTFNSAIFETIEFPMLEFEVKSTEGKFFRENAFADLLIKASRNSMKYNLCVDDHVAHYCNAPDLNIMGDGILFSTPVGTTGYTHNLGGFVCPFNAPIYQVVPMASSVDKKTIRPFPVSIDTEVEVTFNDADYRSGSFFYDGFMLNDKEGYEDFKPNKLKVKKSAHKVKLGFLSLSKFREKSFSWLY